MTAPIPREHDTADRADCNRCGREWDRDLIDSDGDCPECAALAERRELRADLARGLQL